MGDFSKAKQGEFAKIPGKIDTDKITLKFICKGRGTITAKTVLKKKKIKLEASLYLISRLTATVIKTV